jgi:hypothetical protein
MNIKFDADANKFIYFNMGLNYMFITDNMQTSGGDNVFYYDDEQLAKMNTDFINNPPS